MSPFCICIFYFAKAPLPDFKWHLADVAQHLLSSMRATAHEAGVKLSESITQRYCASCSCFLLPGVNCTIRLQKRRRADKTEDKPACKHDDDKDTVEDDGQGSTNRKTIERGQKAAGGSKRVSARTWWDAQSQGRKHSKKLNDLICHCWQCGFSVSWGGSEASTAFCIPLKSTNYIDYSITRNESICRRQQQRKGGKRGAPTVAHSAFATRCLNNAHTIFA